MVTTSAAVVAAMFAASPVPTVPVPTDKPSAVSRPAVDVLMISTCDAVPFVSEVMRKKPPDGAAGQARGCPR